jgi:hypothetical protein
MRFHPIDVVQSANQHDNLPCCTSTADPDRSDSPIESIENICDHRLTLELVSIDTPSESTSHGGLDTTLRLSIAKGRRIAPNGPVKRLPVRVVVATRR